MAINIQKFVAKQSKLVKTNKTTRVSKVDLAGKKIRGVAKLHIVPDVNGLPMLTTKGVFEVHQTESYEYQGEQRTRYPTCIIPAPANYNNVDGAVMPTEMQLKKLDKLYGLLSKYQELTNIYDGKPKIDSKETETQMWVKYMGTYTKMWAKIDEIKPTAPDPKAKAIDTSKLLMVTHNSKNFVNAFNKWATPDEDSETSVEDQLAKVEAALSNEVSDAARCIKITTEKVDVGYSVEFGNLKPENSSVEITEEDLKSATPLIQEDWDYTVFDDEKVDKLTARLTEYMKDVSDDDEDEDSEESDDDNDEDEENPFDSDDSDDE